MKTIFELRITRQIEYVRTNPHIFKTHTGTSSRPSTKRVYEKVANLTFYLSDRA